MHLYNPNILVSRKSRIIPYSLIPFLVGDREISICKPGSFNELDINQIIKTKSLLTLYPRKDTDTFQRMLPSTVDMRYALKILSVSSDRTQTL